MASMSSRSEVSSTGTKVYRFAKSASGAGSVRSHNFEYDVYIFYDLEDHDFVSKHIICHLDSEYSGNYKCCYEVKDFLPGFYYDQCIHKAMKESYWTFLVFSHTSVSKGYTNFLYHQSIYATGAQRFLPIKIDDCLIPEALEDVKIELDFTVMPPEEFRRRLVAVISQATCLLPDPRRPTLAPRQPPSRPRAPSAGSVQSQSEETLPDNDSVYDVPMPSAPVSHYYEKRRVTPFSNEALLIRRKSTGQQPTGSPREDTSYDDAPPDLPPKQNQKWSVAAFHDNPGLYIDNFNHTNSSSPIFRQFEHTLLGEILPEVRDHRQIPSINAACLVRLTCCPSPVVKRRALCLLENQLVQDDLRTATTANGLVETEELLRESLLNKPFQTETSDFQGERLKVYGRLLFYIAMHIEKRHLTFDPLRVQKVSEVDALVRELLKQIRKVSFPMAYALMMVSHAHAYLAKLVQDLGCGVSEDKISDRIEELSKVTNFQLFTPWYHLESTLRNEHYWVYLDVMLSYVGNLAFKDTPYLHVLLRHLPVLLKPYPTVRVQVCYGVLLNVARMLTSLISRHDRKDIRMSAMFGLKTPRDCPGLASLWSSHLYKVAEFQQGLNDIVHPLLLTAYDLEVRQVIYKVFFESTYLEPSSVRSGRSPDHANQLCMTEENKIVELIKKHLTSLYERVGDRLEFLSHTNRRTNTHVLDAYFNYTTSVVVKIPRMKGRICLVDPKPKSTTAEMLQNEISVIGRLSHKHIVELICRPTVDVKPIHAVFEQLNGGNLQLYLQQARDVCGPVRVSRLELIEKCIQVGEALAYLCQQGVVHRDICAYNVLLKFSTCSPGCSVKLSGFALARRVSPNARLECAAGTSVEDKVLLRWSDPESLFKGVWSMATDMWMFWCLVFEVFTYGAHPFPECLAAVDVPSMIDRGYCLRQPLCMSSDLHLLIQQGLQRNLEQRKTITKFLSSLRQLQQDWTHASRSEESSPHNTNYDMRYPNHPREPMERMTPREFNEKHQAKAPKQQVFSTAHGSIGFKHLQSPDIVDSSEVDQPRDCLKYFRGKAVHVNVEVFRACPEKMEVIETLRQLDSVNVCRILDLSQAGNQATLMTEMDIGGNVLEAVLHNPADFTVEHIVKFMLQVLEGLQQLHTRYHLVHTDLRAQYIYAGAVIPGLAKGYFRVRIGRLSRCKMLYKSTLDREGRTLDSEPIPIDSLRWAPPEVLLAPAYYSRGSDIYSLGLVFWQLLYALQAVDQPDYRLVVPHPDWRLDRHEFHRKLMLGQHPEQPAQCPDWAYILIKMCLRSRYKRPTIDLLQETLTHSQPFKSTLLEGIRHQLTNSVHKPDINYEEGQAQWAPYLGEYQEPLTGGEPSCLSPHFEESDHFYLCHARFGYHTEEDDESLLALPEHSKEVDSNYLYEANAESDIYDYKVTYDDCVSLPLPVDCEYSGYSLPDMGLAAVYDEPIYMTVPDDPPSTRRTDGDGAYNNHSPPKRTEEKDIGGKRFSYQNVSLVGTSVRNRSKSCNEGSQRPGMGGQIQVQQGFAGRGRADGGRGQAEGHNRAQAEGRTSRPISITWASGPTNNQTNPPMARVGSAPTSQRITFAQEALQHTKMYRPQSVATKNKSAAFIHHPISDNDTYSHVTKHYL